MANLTVGKIEFAPDYGKPSGLYRPQLDGAFDFVGTISPPDQSGDTPFYRRSPIAANDNARRLPSVVALTGLAGSGKSTLADYLIQRHGYTRVKFAGPLKAMMRAIGLGDAEIEGNLKEVPCSLLQGRTPRYAMQQLGTAFGRDLIGPDFWTGLWSATANDVLDNGGRVVVDDCRFDNEADTIRQFGGVVFRLEGRGGIPGGHISEQGVDADLVLTNKGTVQELQSRLDNELFGWRG